jgi:hypothetical protein
MVQSHKSNTRRCCGSAATSTSNARLWRRQAAQRSAAQSSAEVIDPHPHLQLPRAEIPGSALPNVTCRALQPHFFFFPGKAEQSLTVSGEAQVKALPIGGDSFLLLLNSLRSRIVGTRGTNPTPYSSISTNKIRTPSQGCNREGLLVFRLRLYPPGSTALEQDLGSHILFRLHPACFALTISILCRHHVTSCQCRGGHRNGIRLWIAATIRLIETVPAERRQGVLRSFCKRKPKRRGVTVELKPLQNGVLKAKRLGIKMATLPTERERRAVNFGKKHDILGVP